MADGCPSNSATARFAHWARPLLVALALVAGVTWTWNFCPDPVIDFGREIYLPWRISEGEVLYRDLNSFNGPLAPYVNALAFEVLGVSLRTMKLINSAFALGIALLIYRLIREISNCLAGVMAGVVFAGVFAAGHYGPANFNYLAPYSHDLTHGTALGLAMIACLWRAEMTQRRAWLVAAGFALGLVMLTKVEVSLAAAAAAVAAIALMLLRPRREHEDLSRATVLIVFTIPAMLVPLAAIMLLALAMPWGEAVVHASGSWLWISDERITRLQFYRWVMGTDDLESNLHKMLLWIGRYTLLIASAALLGVCVRGRMRYSAGSAAVAVGAAVAVAAGLGLVLRIPWAGMLRPLPLFILLIAIIAAVRCVSAPQQFSRWLMCLSLAVFSLLLMLKIFFNAHVYHYGFVLAMPGTMLLVAVLLGWLPECVAWLGGSARVSRGMMLGAIAVTLGVHLSATAQQFELRSEPLASGADGFLADKRATPLRAALRQLDELRKPGDTLVVLPEGAMLNYLLRLPNPTRFQNFLPSEMLMYGEQTMLEQLRRRPPQFIAVVHRDAEEYEAAEFGEDYGLQLARWVRQQYQPLAIHGAPPFTGNGFGVLLLRRREDTKG